MTIGMVEVARCAARAAAIVVTRITLAFDQPVFSQTLLERLGQRGGGIGCSCDQEADADNCSLRARRKRHARRDTSDQRDELPPLHPNALNIFRVWAEPTGNSMRHGGACQAIETTGR
jgi:hypothetical protein